MVLPNGKTHAKPITTYENIRYLDILIGFKAGKLFFGMLLFMGTAFECKCV